MKGIKIWNPGPFGDEDVILPNRNKTNRSNSFTIRTVKNNENGNVTIKIMIEMI